jgi:integrase
MPSEAITKPVRHKPTKVTGIYYSVNAKGRKTFECRYTDSTGKRVYEAVGTFEQAKARLAEVTGRKFKGEVVVNVNTTVAELIEGWRAIRDAKPRSRESEERNIRLHIAPRWARVKTREVSKVAIQEWLRGIERQDGKPGPLNDGTKALVLSTFSSILDYGVDAGALAVNPVKTLGRKAKPRQGKIEARILQPGEFEALIAACERFPWLRDIILASLYGGLRLGEVCGLQWADVDFERNKLIVRRQLGKDGNLGTPKGGMVAEIDLLPELRKLLLELKMAARDKSSGAPVFTNKFGGYRQPRDVQRAFQKARLYARLSAEPRALRYHDLRHTAISRLANVPGAVLPEVQRFARHASLVTTMGYIHHIENGTWVEQAATALAVL